MVSTQLSFSSKHSLQTRLIFYNLVNIPLKKAIFYGVKNAQKKLK